MVATEAGTPEAAMHASSAQAVTSMTKTLPYGVSIATGSLVTIR